MINLLNATHVYRDGGMGGAAHELVSAAENTKGIAIKMYFLQAGGSGITARIIVDGVTFDLAEGATSFVVNKTVAPAQPIMIPAGKKLEIETNNVNAKMGIHYEVLA